MKARSPSPAGENPLAGTHLGSWSVAGGSRPGLLPDLAQASWIELQSQPGRVAYRVKCAAGTFFAKSYEPRSLRHRLRDFVFRRKPGRAFRLGLRLLEAGLNTPEPLGLYFRGGPLPHRALLVTNWIGDPVRWLVHLRDLAAAGEDLRRQQALAALAETVGRLHALGFYHGDLRGNMIFAADRDDAAYVIDLEDLRRPLTARRRTKNLTRLTRALPEPETVSFLERRRFLFAYAGAAGLGRGRVRGLWEEVRGDAADRV